MIFIYSKNAQTTARNVLLTVPVCSAIKVKFCGKHNVYVKMDKSKPDQANVKVASYFQISLR
jgi:hypothetical protein